jgi:hypothetical protein
VNLTQLAARGTALDLTLAEVRGEVRVTRLPQAKPRRNQLVYTAARVGGSRGGGSQKVG